MFLKWLPVIPCLFLSVIGFASAATVEYTFNVGWMEYNPDGLLTRQAYFRHRRHHHTDLGRPIIAINNQWPAPTIRANVGDIVLVNVNNNLGNETLTIHWHGLLQTGNAHNDGTPMVSQCPIIPGSSYTYEFTVGRDSIPQTVLF